MANMSLTIYFVEQVGNYYTFRLRWTPYSPLLEAFLWAIGQDSMASLLPDEFINQMLAAGLVPQFIPSGAQFEYFNQNPYVVPENLYLDYVELNPMMPPVFLTTASVIDFRKKILLGATIYYKNEAALYHIPPAPDPLQQAVTSTTGTGGLPPGVSHYTPVENWAYDWLTIFRKNLYFEYTYAAIPFLWKIVPTIFPNIVTDWEVVQPLAEMYCVRAERVLSMHTIISESRGWTFDFGDDFYGNYLKVLRARPPLPDLWFPDHTPVGGGVGGGGGGAGSDGMGGGGGGEAPPLPPIGGDMLPVVSDPNPPPLSIPLLSYDIPASGPTPGYDKLLINGAEVRVNGLKIRWAVPLE